VTINIKQLEGVAIIGLVLYLAFLHGMTIDDYVHILYIVIYE